MLGAIIAGIMIGALISSFAYDFIYSFANQELRSEVKKLIDAAYKEGVSIGSVKHYLNRFHEICKEQVDSMAGLDRPSVSAAFSRHRNNVIQHLKSLEKEKITLCKAIIAAGVDPVMAVHTDGQEKSMKMSELLVLLESNQASAEAPDKTPSPKTESKYPRKTLKLIVDNEDKDDSSNPKVH